MSNGETVCQYSKMSLESRRKIIRDLTSATTLVSRAAKKQQRVPAFGRIDDKIYTAEGLEKKAVFPVGPNIKFSATFNCAEPINPEHNEWLEPESVRGKKSNVAVLSNLSRNKKPHVQDGLLG